MGRWQGADWGHRGEWRRAEKSGKLRSEGGIQSAPCGESLDPPLESTTGRLATGCAGSFIRGGLKSALPVRHGSCSSDAFLSTSGALSFYPGVSPI